LVGVAGDAYRMGYTALRWPLSLTVIMAAWLLYAPRVFALAKKYRFVSPIAPVHWRFRNRILTTTTAILALVPLYIYVIAQFVSIGDTTEGLTGGRISKIWGVIFCGAIVLIYEFLGGMRGVAYTDVLQGFCLIIGSFFMGIVAIYAHGGLIEAYDIIQHNWPEKTQVPDFEGKMHIFSFSILFLGYANYGSIMQRMFSPKDKKALTLSISILSFCPYFLHMIPIVVGLIHLSRSPDYPGFNNADQTFSVVIAEMVRSGDAFQYLTSCLMLTVSLAAIMSSIDSALLTISSIVSIDLIKPVIQLFKYEVEESKYLIFSKLLSLGMVVIIAPLSTFVKPDLSTLIVVQNNLVLQLVPPYFCALYRPNQHWVPTFLGLTLATIGVFLTELFGVKETIAPGLIMLFANILICVIGQFILKHYGYVATANRENAEGEFPADEPSSRYWVWIVMAIGIAALTPWYWTSGTQSSGIIGFPAWGFVCLLVGIGVTIFGVTMLAVFWKEPTSTIGPTTTIEYDDDFNIVGEASYLLVETKPGTIEPVQIPRNSHYGSMSYALRGQTV